MKKEHRVDLRLGLILAGALAVGAVGCASGGGGGGGGGTTGGPSMSGEEIAQGERPRQNDMTRAAADALEEADDILADAESQGGDMDAARAEARPLYQTALEQAQQAIAADSTNPLPWYQTGLANLGLDNYEAAGEALDRAEELRPVYQLEIEPLRERRWIALFNEGQPLINSGDYEGAARVFEQADAIYEGRPEVKIVLGQIYSALGRAEESVDLWRESMDIISSERAEEMDSATVAQWQEHAETLPLAIADALIASENYDEAADQLRMLRRDDPNNIVLARNLASVYIRTDQPDSAAVIYDELLSRPGLTGPDYYQIGVGLYNMERYEDAGDAFGEALDADPMNRDAAEMRARSVQLAINELPEGEEPPESTIMNLQDAAEAWLEHDPYSRNAHIIAAQAANRLGNEDRARELVESAQALPVDVTNLQLQSRDGGATVTGQVINLTAEPGTEITFEFTFYGSDGQPVGTETTTVQLPAQEASQALRLEFESTQDVAGYGYAIEGLSP
ncbi:MAG: tetratricopeptide repeat protein [Gemmatimonadota bacterium]